MHTAFAIPAAVIVLMEHNLGGQMVLEVPCENHDAFVSLPQVVDFKGVRCVRTGWSSDTGRACFKQSAAFAVAVAS